MFDLLVILTAPLDAARAAATIQRARETAFRPQALRFALPKELEGVCDGALYYEHLSSLAQYETGAAWFLLLSGAHGFSQRWDAALKGLWRGIGKRRMLLTGSITPLAEQAPPSADDAPTKRMPKLNGLQSLKQSLPQLEARAQDVWKLPEIPKPKPVFPVLPIRRPPAPEADACLPALKETIEEGQVVIGRGLPLICAASPVPTLLIDPALLFGPMAFWQDAYPDMLSLSAHLCGWTVYALHQPLLWPLQEPPRRFLLRPSEEAAPGTTLSRFEQLLGFRDGQWKTDAKAAMGLFGPSNTYAQQMPPALLLHQRAQSAKSKLLETPMPLIVSAFIDLPNPRFTPAFYTLRFGFLRRLANLPLMLYTGGSQERQLRASFPNTQSYPDNSLLPRTLLSDGMTAAQHFGRSKPLLLLRASRRQPEFEHLAWVDMDILPHPICPDAQPDFTHLMDDRIHLATVDGVPDLSFIVIPSQYLPVLAREVKSITLLDAELKRGLSEELLWQRLFLQKPQWFAVHSMPRRRMLFLTCFEPRLLSRALRAQLSDLPKPYLGTAADSGRARRQGGESHE